MAKSKKLKVNKHPNGKVGEKLPAALESGLPRALRTIIFGMKSRQNNGFFHFSLWFFDYSDVRPLDLFVSSFIFYAIIRELEKNQ
jgi:hypothetical protein